MAPPQETFAQPAVIPTRPAKAPFKLMVTSGLPNLNQETSIAAMVPVTAEILVIKAIRPIDPSPTVVEPALKPNQANQRMKTPKDAIGILCPGIALTIPPGPYLPFLAPIVIAPANANHPPKLWTTLDPAKSIKAPVLRPSNQPDPFAKLPQAHEPDMG